TLCLAQIGTLQCQRGGTPVQNRSSRFLLPVASQQIRSLAFVITGLAKAFSGRLKVAITAGQFGLVHQPHGLMMKFLDLIHRCTTLARGVPNSTTTTYCVASARSFQ